MHQLLDVSAQLNLEADGVATDSHNISCEDVCKNLLDGDTLVTACKDKVIRLWDIKTGTNNY